MQKFPFILDEIGNEQRGRRFAIIIDEAHSSQGGRTSGAMTQALAEAGQADEAETFADQINRLMASRRLLPNASYFAFTATPKNKTLEIFGDPDPQPDGTTKHHPFHSYTMKQAIQEGFILDVLQHYTPVQGYYKLAKTVEDDPEFDTRKAQRKLRRFVEGSRPRHPPQGRDHGGPLPRPSAHAGQGRRPGARHGSHQRHRARHPVLSRRA